MGIGGEIETQEGLVVATVMKGRVGIGFGGGVAKVESDLVGGLVVLERDIVIGFPCDVCIGFVGA